MEYIDFHDFQDEYVPLKKELKSQRQSLFEVDDCEKRAEILSRIDSADWQLRGLHLKFGRCFPDIAQALDNGATLENFETMLNCRIGIMNGKYKDPKQTEQEKINERAKRELEETKKLLEEYKNYKGVPMPESFKELGRKWGLR